MALCIDAAPPALVELLDGSERLALAETDLVLLGCVVAVNEEGQRTEEKRKRWLQSSLVHGYGALT